MRSREVAGREGLVAGGDDHGHPARVCERNRSVRVAVAARDDDARDRVMAEAQVDDLRAVPNCEADPAGDAAIGPRPGAVEHLHGEHARGGRDAGNAFPVPGGRRDDPRDVGAVPVVVSRDGAGFRAPASARWNEQRDAVFRVMSDPGSMSRRPCRSGWRVSTPVSTTATMTLAPRVAAPGLRRLDRRQAPLAAGTRVVRPRGRGPAGACVVAGSASGYGREQQRKRRHSEKERPHPETTIQKSLEMPIGEPCLCASSSLPL